MRSWIASPYSAPLAAASAAYLAAWLGLAWYRRWKLSRLRRMLQEVTAALDDIATYWVDFGTLLGLWRDRNIIAHDNDCDLVVLQPDWDKLCAALEERLGGRGYELEFCQTRSGLKPTTEDPRWVRVLPKEGPRTIWIDLFGAFEGSKKQADSTAAAAANAVGRAGSAAKPPSSAAEATTRAAAAAADTAPGPASDGALPVTFKPAASATAFGDAQVGGAADRGEQDNVDDNDGNPHSGRWLMLSKSASTNIPRRLVLPLKRLPLFGDPRRQVPMPADVPGVLRFRYGPDYMKPAYVHKGRDAAEGRKKYARLMRLLGRLGLRI